MISRLGFSGESMQAHISAYERKHQNRVPPLRVVLRYARCAGVPMEMLVDDRLAVPNKLPADKQGERIRERRSKSPAHDPQILKNKSTGRRSRGIFLAQRLLKPGGTLIVECQISFVILIPASTA